jgi:urease accessory protein
LAATPALAHPMPLGIGGFWGGVLHPLFVIDHVMAVLALGLLMGSQERWGRLPPIAYAVGIAAGLAVMMSGVVPRYANETILGIAVIAGILVALALPLPAWLGAVLGGILGVAIALDSPPEVLSVSEANLMLLGTAIGATAFMSVVWQATRNVQARWAQIGVRAAGSWIAAAAILALALRFVR